MDNLEMARPRIPLNIIKLKGSDKVNPGRFKDRENQMQPDDIGRVPKHLEQEFRVIWHEIIKIMPAETVKKTDRVALELLCKLIHKMRTDFTGMSASHLSKLETLLGRFGMTPSDRSKIIVTSQKEHNPFDDL